MEQETVLSLLQQAGEHYLSGEAMSRQLGITRAAVWKQISRLREKGYGIEVCAAWATPHSPPVITTGSATFT